MGVESSLEGRQLGPYTVGRRLGAGGIGAVYEATHARTGKAYALKVLLPEAAGEQGLARFRREARALGALGHAGIVGIHDFDTAEDGTAFLVMDRLDGCDLAERLEQHALPIPRAIQLLGEICSALTCAHEAGILHRDLKPSNVFLATQPGAPERAVLLDFGLAKSADGSDARLTATGAAMGTPLYMAPEQARGVAVDERTDIYALGCIAYEMLGGRPPFTGPTLTAILSKVLTEEPPALQSLRQDVPPALAAAVHQALAKDPAARPHNVPTFWNNLQAAAGGNHQAAAIAPTQAVVTPPTAVQAAHTPPMSPFTPQGVGVATTGAIRTKRKSSALIFVGVGALLLGALAVTAAVSFYALELGQRDQPVAEVVPAAPIPGLPPAQTAAAETEAETEVETGAGMGTAAASDPSPSADETEPTEPVALAEPPATKRPSMRASMRSSRAAARAQTPSTPPAPAAPAQLPAGTSAIARQQIRLAEQRIASMERFRPLLRAHGEGLRGSAKPRWCNSLPNLRPFRQDQMLSGIVSTLEDQRTTFCEGFAGWENPTPDVRASIANLPQQIAEAREDVVELSERRISEEQRRVALQQLDAAKRRLNRGGRFPCLAPEIAAIKQNMVSRVRQLGGRVNQICNAMGVNRLQGQRDGIRQLIRTYESTLDQMIGGQRQVIATYAAM